jgi:MFS family permease
MMIGALPLLAASLTRDPRLISLSEAAGQSGWLLLGLIAGGYVDRWNRTMVMWRTDLVRALVAGAFAACVLIDLATMPLVLGFGFVLGLIAPFFDNASIAAVPQIVKPHQLERANTLNQTSALLSINLLGPPAGAALFVLLPGAPFAIQATTLAIGSTLVFCIRNAAPAPQSQTDHHLGRELGDGLRFVFRRKPLLRLLAMLLTLINGATGAVTAVLVLYVLDILHLPRIAFGWMDTIVALGGLAGAALTTRLAAKVGRRTTIIAAPILFGLAIGGLGIWPAPAFVVVCLILLGLAAASWNILAGSTMQRETPADLMGRVGSVFRFCGFVAMPGGALVGGLTAHTFGIQTLYLLAGALIVAVTIAAIPTIKATMPASSPASSTRP